MAHAVMANVVMASLDMAWLLDVRFCCSGSSWFKCSPFMGQDDSYVVMGYMGMACIAMAFIAMAHSVMAFVAMAFIVIAFITLAVAVTALTIMARTRIVHMEATPNLICTSTRVYARTHTRTHAHQAP